MFLSQRLVLSGSYNNIIIGVFHHTIVQSTKCKICVPKNSETDEADGASFLVHPVQCFAVSSTGWRNERPSSQRGSLCKDIALCHCDLPFNAH